VDDGGFVALDDDGGGEDDYFFGHQQEGDAGIVCVDAEEASQKTSLLTADQIEDQAFVDLFMSDVNSTVLDSKYTYPKISIMVRKINSY
jgi:hypothetical protein